HLTPSSHPPSLSSLLPPSPPPPTNSSLSETACFSCCSVMASSSSIDDHALLLGLTLSSSHHPPPPTPNSHHLIHAGNPNNSADALTLTLLSSSTVLASDEAHLNPYNNTDQVINKDYSADDHQRRQLSPPLSAVSSFSAISGASKVVVMKRERDLSMSTTEEMEADQRVSSRNSDVDDDDAAGSVRKKLRLTKDQSALLEDSFNHHSTLNPKQKQALARQLGLRARQVEVWFQNRRARTKLKQTEVDCEFLKKCCETLTDENRRLQKELQELKALNLTVPPAVMPAATLTICPSCERIGAGSSAASPIATPGPSISPFSMATKSHFFNPFANPSAAC
ncbi:Homeobox-leucine zipper protein HAT22, partial [Linum perenne]